LHHSLDCEFSACGKAEEEVLSRASQHAQGVHKMKGFSQDFYETARSAIREGYWCMEGGFSKITKRKYSSEAKKAEPNFDPAFLEINLTL